MSLETKGFQELIDHLDGLAKVGETHGKQALQEAGDIVRRIEVDVAKHTHKKYSQKVGFNELKKYPIRNGKLGGKYLSVGIKTTQTKSQKKKDEANVKAGKSRPTHWDKVKGLFFNNYGFYHNKTGAYIAGSNWIDEAFDKSRDEAYEKVREVLEKGMDLK